MLPPELRWQSGRLLTDRSLVRSQVVASFIIDFLQGVSFTALYIHLAFIRAGLKGSYQLVFASSPFKRSQGCFWACFLCATPVA